MSVNSVQQFLNVRDSHLRVVSGNVHADQMVLGGITVDTSHGLQSVTDTSNVTTNTIEFSNATTAFVTTANATIGGNTTIGGYTTIGGDLTVSGNTFYSNNTSINIDSNVVVEFTGPHDRGTVPLKKYPEVVFDDAENVAVRGDDFETTEFTSNALGRPAFFFQGGHKITSSGSYTSAYQPYRLFDHQYNNDTSQYAWYSRNVAGNYTPHYNGSPATNLGTDSGGSATANGEYVAIEMPKKICVKEYKVYGPNTEEEFPQDWTIYGSNDGTEWVSIDTQTNQKLGFRDTNGVQAISGGVAPDTANRTGSGFIKTYSFTNTTYYNNYAIVVTKSGGTYYFGLSGLEFYGYEEDPPAGDTSVDTTFTSIMNTPQTTGANVYVDGNLGETFTNRVTGPTVSNTHTTYVSAGKYWELSGNVESNVTVEANTFLSGDAPHTVSMWFNSSDLEANVSNSCIFSILNGQEKIHHEGAAHNSRYGLNWFSQKLRASDGGASNWFGAGNGEIGLGMSSDGSIIVAGARYNDGNKGAVYIYIKDKNGLWREVQKLTASDVTGDDLFGGSVDISSDGNYIVIGARMAHSTDGLNTSNVGKVYIFKRTTGTNSWVEQQILSSSQEDQDDHFGRRVSISSDGTYVVAAAENDDEDVNNGGGVYVFKRTGNTWSTGNRLTITGVEASDHIASVVDISDDGNFIAIGVQYEDVVTAHNDNVGCVYMFARTGDNTWTQQQKISNPDISGSVYAGTTNNYFGGENQGLSISSDGTYLIVGAYGRASQNGAVFFFKRTGSSTSDWTWSIMSGTGEGGASSGTYTNPTGETGELFGRAVKISPDGLTALVHARKEREYGASAQDQADVGAVYVYNRSGDNWVYSHEVKHRDTSAIDHFGSVFAISTDGSYFVAGIGRDDDLGSESGAVYVFTRDTTQYLDTDLKIHPNTWHNLTYTYGGGGGYKAMYLDGRKVTEIHRTKDTFMKYPPMEMNGYEKNGYRVSHSSQHASYPSWYAFDRETAHVGSDNSWISSNYMYSTSNGTVDRGKGTTTFVDGVPRYGEWIQMMFPKKMKIQTVELAPQTDSEHLRSPRDGIFCGSNDGITWEKLHEYTNKNWVSGITWVDNRYESFVMDTNLDKAYKYIRFVIERVVGASGYASLAEIKFYGHEENDIIRLPDPTNLIKFPHVPLRTHAQRGYVVSVPVDATNGYNVIENVNQDRRAWMAFDGRTDGTDNTIWQMGNNSSYTSGTGVATSHAPVVPGHTTRGGWVKLELPNKVLLSKIRVYSQNAKNITTSEGVNSAKIYGSNDDSSWDVIKDTYALNYADTSVTMAEDTISTSTAYKYIIFQIVKTGGGQGAACHEIEYYGIEQGNSVPVQIGGGNIDKIANFRVYNRSINEDQILEIWDSQKDEFRGVKSSMTLHKGRLGLGTTEPEGRLSILDEPHIIEQFPPGPMNRYQSYFDGYGMFSASSSSYNTTGNGGTYNAWKAFQETYVGGGGWMSGPDTYNDTSGLPTATSDNINGKRGEWLQLALPFKILLRRVEIASRTVSLHPRALRECTIWGSNDSTNWEELKVFTGRYPNLMDGSWNATTSSIIADTTGNVNYVDINSTKAYSFYRAQVNSLHVTEYGSDEGALISAWRLYGSREQSQSTWNDGELVTTKSLTVPRIGPSLGYQIPRRDKLILEYDTSLPIHQERPIDTSGNSYDGTYIGHMRERSWNADRAFNFDGTGDYSTTTINRGGSSDWIHSISFWFKLTRDQLTGAAVGGRIDPFSIGSNSPSNYSACDISVSNITWYFYSNDASYGISGIRAGDWHHLVFSYEGGGERQSRRCFFDGVEYRNRVATLNQAVLDMASSPTVYIGRDGGRGISDFEGEIAKFRIYGCALTLSEAIQLYKEGPKTSPHHLQLVDSTMTIGSHDHNHIAQLDVAGHILAGSQTIHTFTGQHRCFPDEPMEKGLIVSAKKNKFVKLNGFATGQKAITIDESLPIVSLSNVAQDKACFGVVSSIETPALKRRQTISGVISQVDKLSGDNRAIVNSVGEGAIWVVDTNGLLESGDYITTSNVAGYGQKQEDDVLHNYTVAKITMDCDFTESNVAVQTIKREETGLRTITEDTWNELVDYDRSSNTEAEITTYYQIQRGENVLDENGQLQFEDKTGATEAPYKRRFLDASGIQTDEANAVHIAAFVGCTYHCG